MSAEGLKEKIQAFCSDDNCWSQTEFDQGIGVTQANLLFGVSSVVKWSGILDSHCIWRSRVKGGTLLASMPNPAKVKTSCLCHSTWKHFMGLVVFPRKCHYCLHCSIKYFLTMKHHPLLKTVLPMTDSCPAAHWYPSYMHSFWSVLLLNLFWYSGRETSVCKALKYYYTSFL